MKKEKIILADQPLESPEQDKLGFAPFAQHIATIIKNLQVKESVVFGLYGKWGTGKTTFLNFLTYYLNDDESIVIVKFNPWWFSGKEDLIGQFLQNIKLTFDKSTKTMQKNISKKIDPYIKALGAVPKVGWIAKTWMEYEKASEKTVEEAKEEIIQQLNKIDGKIVVFVDDIDRLTAQEIRELFTIVKAIADFPNTVYILAFDKEVVIKALEKVQEGKGEDYLEKIIQAPIELPLINKTTIRKMLFEELDEVLSGTPNELFDSTYWENVYQDGIDSFINTVRDVKRLTNALRITYPSVKGEVNAVDFIAIETLRIFCPEVYNLVKDNLSMFCGHSNEFNLYGSRGKEILKQFHQNWISDLNLPDNLKEKIKELLKRLFPKLESIFENMHYGPEWELDWRKKCRVCSKEIFSRFFSFSISPDDLSKAEMEAILSSLPDKEMFCTHLKHLVTEKRSDNSTKLSVFLEKMEDYTSEIPKDNIPSVIETFFAVGDELIIPEDEDEGFLYWGNDVRMRRIIRQLLRRYRDKNDRFKILKNAFEKGQAISMMVIQLTSFWQQHGKYEGTKKSDKDILLDEAHLETLQKIALNKIKEATEKDRLLNTPFLPAVLYRWKEWGNEREVKDWVSNIVASNEKLPIFLSRFLQKTRSVAINDRVAKIDWRLNPNKLKDLIDLDMLEIKCNEVLSNNSIATKLNVKEKLAVKQFLKEKHLMDKGKNPDDPFFLEK